MARTPAYWTNKRCWPSVQAVSQLSLSQAPHGFGASYRGFPAFLAPSKTAKLCWLVHVYTIVQAVPAFKYEHGYQLVTLHHVIVAIASSCSVHEAI